MCRDLYRADIYIYSEREGIEICIYVYMYIRLTHYILSIYRAHGAICGLSFFVAVGFIRADTAFIYIRASDVGCVRLRFRWVVHIVCILGFTLL